ncbi:hypothetical protein CI238_07960, partial [Colletotrichum incanum]
LNHAGATNIRVNDVEQRNAEPQTVETGHVRPAQDTNGPDTVAALQLRSNLCRDTTQLQSADTAEVVDQKHNLVRVDVQKRPVLVALVQQLREHLAHQLRQIRLLPTGAGLIVNAHAELRLAKLQRALVLSAGDRAAGNMHMLQARADANQVLRRQPGDLCNLDQRPALRRQRTGDLVHKHGARDAPPPDLACLGPADADIVPDYDHLDLEPGGAGLLDGHAEVQHVTRVVHDGNEDALGRVDARRDGSAHLLGAGAGEDCAGDGGREEALADHGREGRLVARAAARDHGDLRHGIGGRPAVDDLVGLVEGEARVREG